MQIFGGPTAVTINATATSIVGNQRQTPALLTLSNGSCALTLTGAADLTVLGDVYTNGTACVDANLHEAGNCYGAAGSNCNNAQYYCYNSTPGFVPYPPPCAPGDTQGSAVVPAPTLPDPGYQFCTVVCVLSRGWGLLKAESRDVDPDGPGDLRHLPPHRWLGELRVSDGGCLHVGQRLHVGCHGQLAVQRAEGPG